MNCGMSCGAWSVCVVDGRCIRSSVDTAELLPILGDLAAAIAALEGRDPVVARNLARM